MNVSEFLNRRRVLFQTYDHAPSYSAQRMAKNIHLSGKRVAKTILLKVWMTPNTVRPDYVVAVLPATRFVDTQKLVRQLRAFRVLLATQEDVAARFPDCELGAIPPFGSEYGMKTVLDTRLSDQTNLVFEGGTHRETIKMLVEDFVLLEKPTTADISRDRRISFNANCPKSNTNLLTEFEKDQQATIALLSKVRGLLNKGEITRARVFCDELDRLAGPLVRFHKLDLYPRISGVAIQSAYTQQLTKRQRKAAIAIRMLLENSTPTQSKLREISDGLRTGLDYLRSCNAFADLLEALPSEAQRQSLLVLLECRRNPRTWTDMVRYQS